MSTKSEKAPKLSGHSTIMDENENVLYLGWRWVKRRGRDTLGASDPMDRRRGLHLERKAADLFKLDTPRHKPLHGREFTTVVDGINAVAEYFSAERTGIDGALPLADVNPDDVAVEATGGGYYAVVIRGEEPKKIRGAANVAAYLESIGVDPAPFFPDADADSDSDSDAEA